MQRVAILYYKSGYIHWASQNVYNYGILCNYVAYKEHQNAVEC